MLFKTIATAFSGILLAQGAFAALTAKQVVSNIGVVTTISKDTNSILGELTPTSPLGQVQTKGQAAIQNFQTIVSHLSADTHSMQGITFTGNASQSIVNAYIGFVHVHQVLLSTVIGKHDIFAQYQFTAPLAAVLKGLEASIDAFSFALIDIITARQSDVRTGNDQLDTSLGNVISLYEQLCIPSPAYPDVQPVCVSI